MLLVLILKIINLIAKIKLESDYKRLYKILYCSLGQYIVFLYPYRYSDIDIFQEEIIDKFSNKIILVNIFDNKNYLNKSETITAFSEHEKEEIFNIDN